MAKLIDVLAPRFSARRLGLSILRDFYHRPSSILGRLAAENRYNARVCDGLQMHCNVCGLDGGMAYDYPDVRLRKAHGIGLLRETLRCKGCGGTMRDRQMAAGLLSLFKERLGLAAGDLKSVRELGQSGLHILDTDSFSAINRTLRGLPGYLHSQYLPGGDNGGVLADGSVNVNLEQMPFEAGRFDLILTSDVMEHVHDDEQAHREIFRCLAPGGAYIFTAPFDPRFQGHQVLTVPAGPSASRFVLEHQVHGDPHARSGIVAHRIYGQQLLGDLGALGFDVEFKSLQLPQAGIFGGDLFMARKRAA